MLVASVSLLFLVGVALGYSIHTAPAIQRLIPQSQRERTFYDAWQQARLSTISPTGNFRVAANGAARDYIYGLSSAAQAVGRGTDAKAVSAVTDVRAQSLAAAFGPVLDQRAQNVQAALWKNAAAATLQYAQTPTAANPTGKTEAVSAMNKSAEQLAAYYSTLSAQLPTPSIQTALIRVLTSLRQAIDAAGNNSVTKVASAEQMAAQNLGNLMDSITAVLVKQNASRF